MLLPLLLIVLLGAVPLHAQSTAGGAAPAGDSAQPPLRRWIEIQSFTVYTRYRFTANSRNTTTTNQLQYKDQLQARVNLDPARRYTIHIGYFTGSNFSGSWNNWGVGHGTTFDGKDNYVKQLYASAAPVDGLELQYGGLYLNRGESDEWVTWDTDGYVAGGRISVRRPKELYLDEITVTRAVFGPRNTPNLFSRWDRLAHPDYTQLLGRKRFSPRVAGSFEYDRQLGADYVRAALTVRLPTSAPVSTLRWEEYRRLNQHAASGVGVWAGWSLPRRVQVQAGFVSVDELYGGWNSDRMLSGRRLFASASVPVYGPLTASFFATQAVGTPYAVSIDRRFDAVLSYNVLDTLRRTGWF